MNRHEKFKVLAELFDRIKDKQQKEMDEYCKTEQEKTGFLKAMCFVKQEIINFECEASDENVRYLMSRG